MLPIPRFQIPINLALRSFPRHDQARVAGGFEHLAGHHELLDPPARRTPRGVWSMAPPAVLDYIVVHELAHLAEPYHSAKFWLIVRSHCPRFEEFREWLKDNEDRIRLPD